MATTSLPRAASRGGSFLIDSCAPEDVFTPADLTDDQKLIGQTAEEFVRNEVVPAIPDLEQHKPGLMAQLLKKAGEIGLLGGGVPDEYGGAGLDKVATVQLAEKLSAYASFGVSHGGHSGIGTLPIVFFGTEQQKKKYLPVLATGEKLAAAAAAPHNCCRQRNSWLVWIPAARATSDATAPGSSVAATIRSFSARDHRRRRCTDVITSTEPFVIGLSLGLVL